MSEQVRRQWYILKSKTLKIQTFRKQVYILKFKVCIYVISSQTLAELKVTDLVGQTGVVISFTVIRVPPADFMDQAPYRWYSFSSRGERITAQMVDWEENIL